MPGRTAFVGYKEFAKAKKGDMLVRVLALLDRKFVVSTRSRVLTFSSQYGRAARQT